MLAVLKAGAAYLPIDPAYPDERIEYLDRRRAAAAGDRARGIRRRRSEAPRSCSDAALTDADRLRPLRPEHLAYVIYTSGSTGRPKGVAVSHHAIAEHIDGFIAEWSMTAEDRLLQSSSVSFDASLLDIFVTLALGARLIVPKPDAFGDIPYVADLISRHGVTVLHMVPSMLSTLLLLPQVSEWRQLRHVPVGGEALPGEVADRFADYFDAELRNHYGPTEAVVCSTHMAVDGSAGHRRRAHRRAEPQRLRLRAGRGAAAGARRGGRRALPRWRAAGARLSGASRADRAAVRRRSVQPRAAAVPIGRSGPAQHLWRAGVRRPRRRAGQGPRFPDRTRRGRVRDRDAPGGRALPRRSPRTPRPGPMLAAYVVPVGDDGRAIDLDDVRAHAAAVLPEYMVPSAFAVIPEIPLTVSGKLDKRALPAATPVAARRLSRAATATERRMCAIFSRLFGCERVGADDSFFELGGHSLLAARLVAQIRAEFGVELQRPRGVRHPDPGRVGERRLGTPRIGAQIELARELVESAVAAGPARRCPTRSWRCGSNIGCGVPTTSSTWRSRFASTVRWTCRARPRRSTTSWPVTRRCARISLNTRVCRTRSFTRRVEVQLAVAEVAADQVDETVAELRRHVFALDSEPLIRPTLLALDRAIARAAPAHPPHRHRSHVTRRPLRGPHDRLPGAAGEQGAAVGHRCRSSSRITHCGNEIPSMRRSEWGQAELALLARRTRRAARRDLGGPRPHRARSVLGSAGEVVDFRGARRAPAPH